MKRVFDVEQAAEVSVAVHEALLVPVDGLAITNSLSELNEALVNKAYTPGSVEPYVPIVPTDARRFCELARAYSKAFNAGPIYVYADQISDNLGSSFEVEVDSVNRRLPHVPYSRQKLFPETAARAMLLGREHADPDLWVTDADTDGMHFTGQTLETSIEYLGSRTLVTPADIVILAAQRLIQGRKLPYGSLTTDYIQYSSHNNSVMNSWVNTDNNGMMFNDTLTSVRGISGVRISVSADNC